MKAAILFTSGGPMAILTSHGSVEDPEVLTQLSAKGISKFVAYDLPLDLARQRYGGHFQAVAEGLHEAEDSRSHDLSIWGIGGGRILRQSN